jgi:hypothetical protein
VSHKISDEVAVALMLSKNLNPLEPYPGRAKPWKSLCLTCQNTVSPRFSSIQRSQGGCIYCANRATISEKQARKIFKDANLKPLVPYEGSRKGWQSKCLICGQISNPRVDTVKNRGAKCRFCSAKERGLAGRMSQEEAFALAEKASLEPLEPYKTSQAKWKCKCLKCGLIITPVLATIILGSGCRNCSTYGISLEKPSYIYLITNSELNAHKVGIANVAKTKLSDRLYHHNKQGWVLVKRWDFVESHNIQTIEKQVFKILRKEMDIPPYLAKDDMPFGGWTETLSADAISVTSLFKLIEIEIAATVSNK